MTAGLIIGGLVLLALIATGIWLMERADAEPAARSNERAPDPDEEREAQATSVGRSSILVEREQ